MDPESRKIKRLSGKIRILESMIEDRSRQAYYEAARRSAINALLELSLRANSIDAFLSQVLDILLSADPLGIDEKGAALLFDQQGKGLELRAHKNLSAEHHSAIHHLPLNHHFCELILSSRTISHILKSNDRFMVHLPGIEPHGHYFVPIRTGNRNYGVIILYTPVNTPKNNDDISFLTTIGDICAGTIERINFGEQLLRYQRNLEQQVEEQTRRLSQEKERLAVTLRSIGDGVIATDLEGNILLVNKVAEQLTGWSQQMAVGRPIQDVFNIINSETGIPAENPLKRVLASGMIVGPADHTALIASDGTQYIIKENSAPIFDRESRMIGAVLVFRDVTVERKTAEELLKIKKLESVGVLAGGIAHDFNNILAAILGNIELAGFSIDPDEGAYPLLQEAKKASLRARDLTHQLLTFSKGGDPVKKAASIGSVITESANFVLHGSRVVCRYHIPDDLWLVDADTGQISQVIQNLVINAKHALQDSGEITICCANIDDIRLEPFQSALPEKKYIRITVQDSGCGIAGRNMDKIFDPYFTTKQEGSGLGLAICHSIISKHYGSIAVQSQVGEGTTFSIYLPASEKKPPLMKQDRGIRRQKASQLRILLMDDDHSVQVAAQEMLNFLGHEVVAAADGRETIRLFGEHRERGNPVDVIIMDLTIPGGMGGKNALQEILKIEPEAKVIVSSGYSNDPIMANYQDYGFKAALSKPFLLEELERTLANVIS